MKIDMVNQRRETPGVVEYLRQDGEDGIGGIEGMAAVYYDGTRATEYAVGPNIVERISSQAFENTDFSEVVGLWNHDDALVLGRNQSGTLQIQLVESGLFYRIPQLPAARLDLAEAIERRDVFGSSFMFVQDPRSVSVTQENELTVLEVKEIIAVRDVGPATRPAYRGTSVNARTEYVGQVLALHSQKQASSAAADQLEQWRANQRRLLYVQRRLYS